jgi:hypothetical protein
MRLIGGAIGSEGGLLGVRQPSGAYPLCGIFNYRMKGMMPSPAERDSIESVIHALLLKSVKYIELAIVTAAFHRKRVDPIVD